MIPKIIHYSWFSGEEMPASFIEMMDTWKRVLPDYELRLWDAQALKEANLTFANEAYGERMWAFAADAIRCYAVWKYGGIWLDGDVAVYKSFDPFLKHRMFIGKEAAPTLQLEDNKSWMWKLGSHCFGAEPEHPMLKDCVDYYKDAHFVQSTNQNLPRSLRYNMLIIPIIQARIATRYGYIGDLDDRDKEEILKEDIHVYPPYFFQNPGYNDPKDTVCVHFCYHSWGNAKEDMRNDIRSLTYKKGVQYYLHTWANRILAKRRLKLQVMSY